MDFIQEAPTEKDPYNCGLFPKNYLSKILPKDLFETIDKDLTLFSKKALNQLQDLREQAYNNPPTHIKYDPWGSRIDLIKTSPAWDALKKISAKEGLISIGYNKEYGEFKRVYQFAKLYIFHSYSAFFSCPLAMTDGAVCTLKKFSKNHHFLKHLLSNDPDKFWTSGQWMTEKTGGSDVSAITTTAEKKGDSYLLSGIKWFSSSTTSEMALVLAKIKGQTKSSLFALTTDTDTIEILRLKDKLGTKALPTAELKLNKTPAILIGKQESGIESISSMLNITRIYNSVCSISEAGNIITLLEDYSNKRSAFGKKLSDIPLHKKTIKEMKATFNACFYFTFYVAKLLGKKEILQSSDKENSLLRLFTPILKLFTAKETIKIVSEAIEGFGGAGYVEDTGIPRRLRDAQVFSIWEGTTNILSLDVLRVLNKDNKVLTYLDQEIKNKLKDEPMDLKEEWQRLHQFIINADIKTKELNARSFALSLARLFSALLIEDKDIKNTWIICSPKYEFIKKL